MESLPSLFADASASRQSEKKPHKRVYIALGILAGIIVLSGLAILAMVGLKRFAKSVEEPMTALNIYTDVLIQQDYQSAYEIVSPDFRQQTSFPALVEFHRGLTSKLGALK